MTKRILVLTALLVSTAAIGSALAGGHLARLAGDPLAAIAGLTEDDDGRIVLASAERRHGHHRGEEHSERENRRHGAGHHDRRHHDDDDDDDNRGPGRERRHEERRGNALAPTGPSDPTAPVPQNGVFGGKARPKVEVQ